MAPSLLAAHSGLTALQLLLEWHGWAGDAQPAHLVHSPIWPGVRALAVVLASLPLSLVHRPAAGAWQALVGRLLVRHSLAWQHGSAAPAHLAYVNRPKPSITS